MIGNLALSVFWIAGCVLSKRMTSSWAHPVTVLWLSMGVSYAGTAIFAPEYFLSTSAGFYLIGACATASVACYIWQVGLMGAHEGPRISESFKGARIADVRWGALHPLGLLGVALMFLAIYRTGQFQLSSLTSSDLLFSTAQSVTKTRYTDGLQFPFYYNIGTACAYSYFLFVGIIWGQGKRISLLTIAPSVGFLVVNLLTTTRSPLIFAMLLFGLGGAAGARARYGASLPRRTVLAFARVIGGGLAFLIIVFIGFQIVRFGIHSGQSVGMVWNHLRKWSWGSLPGFSMWWDGRAPAESPHPPGFRTFMGVFSVLGIEDRVSGSYEGYVALSPDDMGNVYTAFRGLIEDFGLVGSFIFMFLYGMLSAISWRKVAMAGGVRWIGIVVVLGVFGAFAFTVSAWSYTSVLLACGLAYFACNVFLKFESCPPMEERVS